MHPGNILLVYAAQPREGTETENIFEKLVENCVVYAAQPREGTETPIIDRHHILGYTRVVYAAQPREGTETISL